MNDFTKGITNSTASVKTMLTIVLSYRSFHFKKSFAGRKEALEIV